MNQHTDIVAGLTWSDERVEALKRLHSEGKVPTEIAAALGGGTTAKAVEAKLARLGLKAADRAVAPPPSKAQEIARLADGSRTVVEIAAELSTSEDYVRQQVSRQGLTLKPQPHAMTEASLWTPEKVEQLKELQAAGRTATQIARALGPGFTRSSVLGKLYRMGLACGGGKKEGPRVRRPESPHGAERMLARIEARKEADARRKQQERDRQTRPQPERASLVEPPRPKRRITAVEVQHHQCHWIHGDVQDDPDWTYCGAPVKGPGGSYCAFHHNIVWERVPARRGPGRPRRAMPAW